MSLPPFELLRPRSLAEALEVLARHAGEAQIVAGGTDLVPSLKQRLFEPRYVVDLKQVAGLDSICNGKGLEIGALTTLDRIAASPEVRKGFPLLAEAVAAIASPVLRTMGTLGGNLCLDTRCLWYNQSYFWRKSCGFCIKKDGDVCHVAPGGKRCWAAFSGDGAPALLALGAEVEVASRAGVRRMPLANLYTGDGRARLTLQPGEVLTRALVPEESAGMRGAYLKFRLRNSIDYPLAGVAVALRVGADGVCEHGAVALTALNPRPLLVPGAGEALRGARYSEELLEQIALLAGRVMKPLTTGVSTPDYRRQIAGVYVKRALRKAWRQNP